MLLGRIAIGDWLTALVGLASLVRDPLFVILICHGDASNEMGDARRLTRQGVHVDRIACSWLIRRFIDADAVIRFVPGKGYVPKAGERMQHLYLFPFSLSLRLVTDVWRPIAGGGS